MADRSERPRGAKNLRFGARKPPRRRVPGGRVGRLAWFQLAAILLVLAAAGAGLQTPAAARKIALLMTGSESVAGTVRRVIDGDGIVVGGTEIRLGDFDAPEYYEPGGQAATAALRSIAFGREVVCTPCEGARRPLQCRSYDRLIATCRLDGVRLGDLMRRRGVQEGGR